MSRRSAVAAAVIGGAIGVFVGVGIQGFMSVEEIGVATPVATEDCPPPVQRSTPAPPDAHDETDEELDSCRFQARLLRGQLQIYEGKWQEWPEEVPEVFDRISLEAILPVAWNDLAVIDHLDCSEYPCLVTLTLPEDQHECCTHLMEALPEELKESGAKNFRTYAHSLEDGPMRAVVTLAFEDHWSEELRSRTKWRVGVAGEQMVDEGVE